MSKTKLNVITKWLISLCIFALSLSAFAINGRTTYQARIVKPDGYPLQSASVNFRFSVLDQSGSCILYVEDFVAINMTDTGGVISFPLGTGARAFPTSGTAQTFQNTFDNSITSFACQTMGIYNPNPTDSRKVVMQFNDGPGWQTLPAMTMNAVPYAMFATKAINSQSLNGKADSAFVEYTALNGLGCAADQAIKYNGVSFSCLTVGGSGTAVTSSSVIAALGYTPATGTSFTSLNSAISTVSSAVYSVSSTVTNLDNFVTSLSNTVAASFSAITSSQWSTSGTTINYLSGNVGIGTLAPVQPLDVAGNGRIQGTLYSNGISRGSASNYMGIYSDVSAGSGAEFNIYGSTHALASGAMTFRTGTTTNAERMRITSSGNIGIGTSAPVTLIHIKTSGTAAITHETSSTNDYAVSRFITPTRRYEWALSGAPTDAFNSFYVYDPVSAAKRLLINSIGNIGIGTISPQSKLHVVGTSQFAREDNNDGNHTAIQIKRLRADSTAPSAGFGANIEFALEGSANDNSHVGAEISSAWENNQTNQTTDQDAFLSFSTILDASRTEKVRITSNGNVGIGTTTPAYQLHVATSTAATVAVAAFETVGTGGRPIAMFRAEGENKGYLGYGLPSSDEFLLINYKPANLSLGAAGVRVLSITASGTVGIGLTSPTAKLHLAAGNSSASPLKLTSGTLTTTPQPGAIEYDGSILYYTDGTNTRRALASNSGSQSITADNNYSGINTFGGQTYVSNNTTSTNSTTGALVVSGGVGIGGALNVAGNITAAGQLISTNSVSAPVIYAGAGSALLPSFTFSTDAATGMWQPTSGAVALSTAGLERIRISSSGNVGIGTSVPGTKLEVEAATGTGIKSTSLAAAGFAGEFYNTDSGGNVYVKLAGAAGTNVAGTFMNGNVGIGTIAPVYPLSVSSSGTTYQAQIHQTGSGANAYSVLRLDNADSPGAVGYLGLGGQSVTNVWMRNVAFFGTQTNNSAAIFTNDLPRLIVAGAGNIGVGTTNPMATVDVAGSGQLWVRESIGGGLPASAGAGLKIEALSSGGNIQAYNYVSGTAINLKFQANGGNVGIGTVNPQAKLDIAGGAGSVMRVMASSNTMATPGPDDDFLLRLMPQNNTTEGGHLEFKGSANYQDWAMDTEGGNLRFFEPNQSRVTSATRGGISFMQNISSTSTPSLVTTVRITNEGKLGVGTEYPVGNLHVKSDNQNTQIRIEGPVSGSQTEIFYRANGIDWATGAGTGNPGSTNYGIYNNTVGLIMSLTASGNVGIGTTAPAYTLDVSGTINAKALKINGTDVATNGGAGGGLNSTSGLVFNTDTDNVGTDGGFSFQKNGVELFSISSAGSVSTHQDLGARFNIGRQDNILEGGELAFAGAGAFDHWIQDVNSNNMRFFTTSASDNMVSFQNTGSGTMNMYVEGTVGIGITSPVSRLHVAGDTTLSIGSKYTWPNDSGGGAGDAGYIRYHFDEGVEDGSLEFVVTNDANDDMKFKAGYFSFMPNQIGTGNVGIGTTTPTRSLEVSGTARFFNLDISGSNGISDDRPYFRGGWDHFVLAPAANRTVGADFNQVYIGYPGDLAAGDTVFTRIQESLFISPTGNTGGGNVGIGTASPTQKLEVRGGDTFLGGKAYVYSNSGWGSNSPLISLAVGDDDTGLNWVSDGVMQISSNNVPRIHISGGGIGVHRTDPSFNLDVSGTFRVTGQAYTDTGAATFTVLSDVRYKDVHGAYERGLADLLKIGTIRYNYKKINPTGADSTHEYVGVSAQNVKQAIPEAVETQSKDGKEFLTVNPSSIIFAMINGFRDMYSIVMGHDREIASLKAKNQELESKLQELDELKAYICKKDPQAPNCK